MRIPPDQHYTALGDSFSAGPGAGNPPGTSKDSVCARTDGSFVYQLQNDPKFFNGVSTDFHINACTGDTTVDILNGQINAADSDFYRGQDIYTITAGGNDLEFGNIVKVCVYNWPGLGGCENLLNGIDAKLAEGSDFLKNLDALYSALRQFAPSRVVVVPYVSFYNSDTEKDGTVDSCWVPTATRQKMNSKTDALNNVLAQHAQTFGLEFVDAGGLQQQFNTHRCCESKETNGGPWFQDSIRGTLSTNDQQALLGVTDPSNVTITAPPDDVGGNRRGVFHPNFDSHHAYYEAIMSHLDPV